MESKQVYAMSVEDALNLLAAVTTNIHPNIVVGMVDEQGNTQSIGSTDRRLHFKVNEAINVLGQFITASKEKDE